MKYVRVSTGFIGDVVRAISAGQSVVLLGPRFSGKRLVVRRAAKELRRHHVTPLIQIAFLADHPICRAEEVRQMVLDALREAGVEPPEGHAGDGMLTALGKVAGDVGERLVLSATSVDRLSHDLSRRFLQEVRTLVGEGRMVALLTGEGELRDYVYGPNSDFDCDHEYVLQGFEFEEYCGVLKQERRFGRVQFSEPATALQLLYERSGGSVALTWLLLWSTTERLVSAEVPAQHLIGTDEIPDCLDPSCVPAEMRGYLLDAAASLVTAEPGCWPDLERLSLGKEVPARGGGPSALELSGIAVRDTSTHTLRIASPLMQDFVAKHFGDRRMGDLLARAHCWEEAFVRYERLPPEERLRPLGRSDHGDTVEVLNALQCSLLVEATNGLDAVKERFVRGARDLLGFEVVSIWQRHRPQAAWQPLAASCRDAGPGLERLLNDLLPGTNVAPGTWRLPDGYDQYACAAILDCVREEARDAVVVGDVAGRASVAPARRRLAEQLLVSLVAANKQAVAQERLRQRLAARDQYASVMQELTHRLGVNVLDVRQALVVAASGLRQLGYKRVLFCLVDAERKRIVGAVDDSVDPRVDVAALTNWLLADHLKDLQPYVVATGQPYVVIDALHDPLANQEVVQQAGIVSAAIVPLLDPHGEVIGTVHVERADGAAPSQAEVTQLLTFGWQLAVVIELSDRVNETLGVLDSAPDAVLIADRIERVRYCNKPMADLLGLEPGWREERASKAMNALPLGALANDLREVLTASPSRLARTVRGFGSAPHYRGTAIAERISDWRNQAVAAMLHIQDVSYLRGLLDVFADYSVAQNAEEAMRKYLDATQALGHAWGRLYQVQGEGDQRVLQSVACYGLADEAARGHFDRGEVKLLPTDSRGEAWVSLTERRPVVFIRLPDRPDGQEVRTRMGLLARNVANPQCPPGLEKQPGQMWLDVPFVAGGSGRHVGKLTLACDADLRPEEFELLRVLWGMAERRLEAYFAEEVRVDREKTEVGEHTIATMSHNLATHLAGLSPMLGCYRLHEADHADLKPLNDLFAMSYDVVLATARRAKDMLRVIHPARQPTDLGDLVAKTLSAVLPESDQWRVERGTDDLIADLDPWLVETALREMLENSCWSAGGRTLVRIEARLSRIRANGESHLELRFADNGRGVPDEARAHVFEPFYTYRPGEDVGLGLGLDFVHRVVEAHGGTVTLADAVGRGATFVVRLPDQPCEAGEGRARCSDS